MSRARAARFERRLVDDLEIRNLLNRVSNLNDAGDLAEYSTCWTQDALWEMPGATYHGRDEILAAAVKRREAGNAGPGTGIRHVVTNVVVYVDGSDTATTESYLVLVRDTTTELPRAAGVYGNRDSFRRTPEGWKLARRIITVG